MKRIIKLLLIGLLLVTYQVNAAEFKAMELIPVNEKSNATVTTDHFKYIDINYNKNNNNISFGTIRNISSEKRFITVTIGLFDSKSENIGTINYCAKDENENGLAGAELDINQGISYTISVDRTYLAKNKNFNNIKYISILSDNINCNTGNALEYVGQKVDKIGQAKNNTLNNSEKLFVKILILIGGVGLFVFIYNYIFSTKYQNIDGEDVREDYNKLNEKLARQREYDAINNPPKPKPVKKNKSDKVIAEEQLEKSKENTNSSDLHNFYK